MSLRNLRKKYPKFVYEKYSYRISKSGLEILFSFKIEPDVSFTPKVVIENVTRAMVKRTGENVLNNLVFNLGLMEMISYWKTTCSPVIEVRAGYLSTEQIRWWQDMIIRGMGQFFFENKINFKSPNFLKIKSSLAERSNDVNLTIVKLTKIKKNKHFNKYLVPFAGGRDSIITLEGLKKQYGLPRIGLFTVNTVPKIQKTVKVTGAKEQILVKRIIDKKLLGLNKRGYLNGHTPFTALLSFLAVLGGVLFDYKNIAFSNEKSANEGNVKYLDKTINHQWAKSSAFEKKFRLYCRKYLAPAINYFSYSRKYTELEISKKLTSYPEYFPYFSSCNAGMKINPPKAKAFRRAGARWCGECVKCLFVYLTLYPFLREKELLKIFGRDIFQNKKLLPLMKDLVEEGRQKPFECVGTKKESRQAFRLCLQKAKKSGKIPYLLTNVNI